MLSTTKNTHLLPDRQFRWKSGSSMGWRSAGTGLVLWRPSCQVWFWLKYKQTKSSLSNNITTSSTCLDESKTKKLKHYLNFCIVWNNYVYFEVLLPFLIDAGLCMTSVGSATFCWRGWWGGRGWRRRSHPARMWGRTLRCGWHPKILINNIITDHSNICKNYCQYRWTSLWGLRSLLRRRKWTKRVLRSTARRLERRFLSFDS